MIIITTLPAIATFHCTNMRIQGTLLILTNNSYFNFSSIRTILVHSMNLVSASVFSFRIIIEELGIVGNILYSAGCCFLNRLVIEAPCHIWWWLTTYLHIKHDWFTLTYCDCPQIAAINFWSHCGNFNQRFQFIFINYGLLVGKISVTVS